MPCGGPDRGDPATVGLHCGVNGLGLGAARRSSIFGPSADENARAADEGDCYG
jgi:hypothetical protein